MSVKKQNQLQRIEAIFEKIFDLIGVKKGMKKRVPSIILFKLLGYKHPAQKAYDYRQKKLKKATFTKIDDQLNKLEDAFNTADQVDIES